MAWISTNYKSKSASKDKDNVFKYKKKGKKKAPNTISAFKEIKKLK